MLSVEETVRSLKGAAALFMGRPEGLDALDRTVDGFWRSFAVILLLLPINALTMFAISRLGDGADFRSVFFGQLPVFALDWVLFPALLALAAKPLGIAGRYVSYVVARNWAAPIMAAIMAVPALLQGAGFIPPTGGALLSMIAIIIVLRYHFVIIRISLDVPVGMAIGLVIADLLLTLVLIGLLG